MDRRNEEMLHLLECCESRRCSECPRFYSEPSEEELCRLLLVHNACSFARDLVERNMILEEKTQSLAVELEAMRGTANSYKRLRVDLAKQVGSLKDELAKRPEPLIITKLPKKKK